MSIMQKRLQDWTIVFDLDGTLVNTAPDLHNTLNHVLQSEGLAPVNLSEISGMIGHGSKAMITKGMQSQGISPEPDQLERLFRQFLAHYADNIAVYSHPFDSVVSTLDWITDEGGRLAVCTNKTQALSDTLLQALDLHHHFVSIVGADSVAQRKPHGGHIHHTVALAGGDINRSIMIGDSRTDERAARNAGLPFIFVPFGYEAETAEQIAADAVANHYDDLPAIVLDIVSSS